MSAYFLVRFLWNTYGYSYIHADPILSIIFELWLTKCDDIYINFNTKFFEHHLLNNVHLNYYAYFSGIISWQGLGHYVVALMSADVNKKNIFERVTVCRKVIDSIEQSDVTFCVVGEIPELSHFWVQNDEFLITLQIS